MDFNNYIYSYLMSSVLSCYITQRIVAISHDVSEQPIGPTIKCQEVHEEASRTANISTTSWRTPENTHIFVFIIY